MRYYWDPAKNEWLLTHRGISFEDVVRAMAQANPAVPAERRARVMARLERGERELLRSVERGEWRSAASKAALKRYTQAARRTLKKDRRVNIRISQVDLKDLQARAFEEGLPYQTLIASVLHKYIAGSLTSKR